MTANPNKSNVGIYGATFESGEQQVAQVTDRSASDVDGLIDDQGNLVVLDGAPDPDDPDQGGSIYEPTNNTYRPAGTRVISG